MLQSPHRTVVSWILVAALWLQAVVVPVQTARAEAAEALLGGLAVPICSSGSAGHQHGPGIPDKQQHHRHDCCLSGGCSISHHAAVLLPFMPQSTASDGRTLFSLVAPVAPRTLRSGLRPFTTGPPAIS